MKLLFVTYECHFSIFQTCFVTHKEAPVIYRVEMVILLLENSCCFLSTSFALVNWLVVVRLGGESCALSEELVNKAVWLKHI